ncbi:MAG: helix-turn-helix domain-containing protein [Eubacterium sp.]|nr:helix-turn-helix domain-containing protein [Eubacterium sp.]
MGNPKLIPYETIVRATSGEPEAVDEVLRYYSRSEIRQEPKKRGRKEPPLHYQF